MYTITAIPCRSSCSASAYLLMYVRMTAGRLLSGVLFLSFTLPQRYPS